MLAQQSNTSNNESASRTLLTASPANCPPCQAIAYAGNRLQRFADRFSLHHSSYHKLKHVLKQAGKPVLNCRVGRLPPGATLNHMSWRCRQPPAGYSSRGSVDGVLLDLGFSSHQVDEASRGFSFRHAGPLDMRFDQVRACACAQW